MRKKGIILALTALAALAGCSKYSVECELVVQPYVMISPSSGAETPAYMARVYAWYISEEEARNQSWLPASYAEAEAGLASRNATDNVRSHSLVGEQDSSEERVDDYVRLTLTSSPVLLVAVDPVNRFYAWRIFRYEMPIERIYIPVSFKIYQATPYRENDWTVISEADENRPQEEENPQDGGE